VSASYRVLSGIVLTGHLLFSTGCINISASLQPEDPAVSPLLHGEDCVPIVFGFSWGTITIERAMLAAAEPDLDKAAGKPIKKIRTIQLTDVEILGFGGRCLEVTGEP